MAHIYALRVSSRLSITKQIHWLRHSATSPYGNSCISGTCRTSNSRAVSQPMRCGGLLTGHAKTRAQDARSQSGSALDLCATGVSATIHVWVLGARIAVWAWIPLLSHEASTNDCSPSAHYLRAFGEQEQGSCVPGNFIAGGPAHQGQVSFG